MFDEHGTDHQLRRFAQEDVLASSIRVALAIAGPVGTILGEFLTQFVPAQRLDRLQHFVESLAERIGDMEREFWERLCSSSAYAALAEEASLSAVRTSSDEHRRDLASLLAHGLSKEESELLEEQALLRLRDRITDAQVLILMSYGNFSRTLGDGALKAFHASYPGLFGLSPPTMTSSAEERRRWTMRQHYETELEALGLLRDTEGTAKSVPRRHEITQLGRLLLEAIDRQGELGESAQA